MQRQHTLFLHPPSQLGGVLALEPTRRLTLRSSGQPPGYRRLPLNSNVRPLKKGAAMSSSGKPPTDPFEEFDLICEFPFAVGAFAELRRYVRAVHQFLPHASAQQAVRIKARLKQEPDPVRTGELEYELEVTDRDSTVTLPRVVWGGVLVSIFAAYENGVRNALKHWRHTTGFPEEFKTLPRKDFLRSAESYAKAHLAVPLFQAEHSREVLVALKGLRNSFAHGSGLVSDLPASLVTAIAQGRHSGAGIEVVEGQWVADARCAAYHLLWAERSSKQFGEAVLGTCLQHHRALQTEA